MSKRDTLLYIEDIMESIGVNPQIVYDAVTLELDELEGIIKNMRGRNDKK